MPRREWTHDELLLAFNLYCKLPFGFFHHNNADVIALSKLIGRTPGAVAMKLANFASLDPKQKSRGIKGLSNRSKADEAAWHEFTNDWDQTVWNSEMLLAQLEKQQPNDEIKSQEFIVQPNESAEWEIPNIGDTQAERITRIRVGQQFFRKTILANYRSRCCVCGMSIPRLLIASHIIPWRDREDLRLNPHNGLCMCALHDRAFDAGFLTISAQYIVIVSKEVFTYLPDESVETSIIRYHESTISTPDKFMPDPSFLKYHMTTYFHDHSNNQ